MAAGVMPEPGTKFGPCERACKHIDCIQTRGDARSLCRLCRKPIGYDRRFYADPEGYGSHVHASCLEDEHEAPR